jgi:hypothetical protein
VIKKDPLPSTDWDSTRTIAFNVQILNMAHFGRVTGLPPPPPVISASTYQQLGLPFFSSWEEYSHKFGKFPGMKSLAELTSLRDPVLKIRIISLDEHMRISDQLVDTNKLNLSEVHELDAVREAAELEEHPTKELPHRPGFETNEAPRVQIDDIHEIDERSAEGRVATDEAPRRSKRIARLTNLRKWISDIVNKEDEGMVPVFVKFGDRKPIQIGLINPKGPMKEFRSVQELEEEIRKKAIVVF